MKRILVCALLASCASSEKPVNEETSAIRRLVQAAEIGTDDGYRRLLAEHKHRGELSAPAGLRRFLASFEPLRMHGYQSLFHEEGKLTLAWFFSEIGLKGEEPDVRRRIQESLASLGFERASGDPAGEMNFLMKGQRVSVRGPHAWVGGRDRACGIELLWRVEDDAWSSVPALGEVLKELPMMKDPRLEPAVYEALGSCASTTVSVGGTWIQYYTWTAVLGTSAEKIARLLKDLGYEEGELTDQGFRPWHRAKSGSYAWLKEDKGRTEIRFQPES